MLDLNKQEQEIPYDKTFLNKMPSLHNMKGS